MLLSSVLQILDQNQIQPKVIEKPKPGFDAEFSAAVEQVAGLQVGSPRTTGAAEFSNPEKVERPSPEKLKAASNLEELLKIITKFEKSNQSRVVDVFE